MRVGWSSVRTAARTLLHGNQLHSRELLMIGIVVSEICWAYKKYNKITSGICLVFYSSVITMMYGPIKIKYFSTSSHKLHDFRKKNVVYETSVLTSIQHLTEKFPILKRNE